MDRSLTAALLRPRHVVASALVFVLLCGTGFAVAGAGPDEPSPAAMPASSPEWMAIPLPAPGDRGVYELGKEPAPAGTDSRYGEVSFGSTEPESFEVQPDRRILNGTGVAHWVNVLVTSQRYVASSSEGPRTVWDNETHLLYAGTTWQAASTSQEDREEATQPAPSPVPLLPAGTSTMTLSYFYTFYQDREAGRLPCGLRHGAQGSSIPLDGRTFRLDAGCWAVGRETDARVVAIGGEAGTRDVRVELSDGTPHGSLPLLWVWFREGLAYPVRIEMPATEAGVPVYWVHSLTSYARGSGAIRTDSEPGDAAPAPQLLPLPVWTMDDQGVDHPFPLSAAFQQARDDPSFPDLREFLQANPGAYIASARHAAFDMPTDGSIRWTVIVTDGEDVYGLAILRRTTHPNVAGFPFPVPGQSPAVTYEYSPSEDTTFSAAAGYLRPEELPPLLPSAASLLDLWALHASPRHVEAGGTSWGFFIARDPDGEGGSPGLWFEAGRTYFVREAGPGYPLSPDFSDTWDTSTIGMYDGWDRVDRYDEIVSRYEQSSTPAASPLPDVDPGQTTPVSAPGGPIAAIAGLWAMPDGPVATSVGIGALLVSLLYWLKPILKAGFVGLFSRVEPEELLENPTRAMLVAAVEANPGIHHQELVRIARKGNGAAEHHLQKLVTGGLLARHKSAGYTCYFRAGKVDRRVMASAHLLKSPVARAIIEAAQRSPGTSLAQVARDAGVSVPTVHYHVQRLQQAGLVRWQGGLHPGLQGAPATAAPAQA
jgi:hypothetical protein